MIEKPTSSKEERKPVHEVKKETPTKEVRSISPEPTKAEAVNTSGHKR
jgi:hypothetical protein